MRLTGAGGIVLDATTEAYVRTCASGSGTVNPVLEAADVGEIDVGVIRPGVLIGGEVWGT